MMIHIDIDDATLSLLERIKQSAGLVGYKDVFSRSLPLFDWAIRQRAEGHVVASVDEKQKTYAEIDVSALVTRSRAA